MRSCLGANSSEGAEVTGTDYFEANTCQLQIVPS